MPDSGSSGTMTKSSATIKDRAQWEGCQAPTIHHHRLQSVPTELIDQRKEDRHRAPLERFCYVGKERVSRHQVQDAIDAALALDKLAHIRVSFASLRSSLILNRNQILVAGVLDFGHGIIILGESEISKLVDRPYLKI